LARKYKDPAVFQSQSENQNFMYVVGNRKIPLCPDGEDRLVDPTNVEEFIQLTCDHVYNMASTQIKWIKEGLHEIVPSTIINLVEWNELEDRTCGMKILDIEKLKKITDYSNCHEDSKVIKWFWNVLSNMEEEDKTLYLKFAWGRSRLPFDCSKLQYRHCLYFASHMSKDSLPESHTCFFQTDLSDYESEELLEKKLLVAIRFCGEIDND